MVPMGICLLEIYLITPNLNTLSAFEKLPTAFMQKPGIYAP